MFPADQLMQAAKAGDALGRRAQHQVIGIAENDVGAGLAHLVEIHRLNSADSADRHEGLGVRISPRGIEIWPRRALSIGFLQGELEGLGHLVFPEEKAGIAIGIEAVACLDGVVIGGAHDIEA